MKFFSTILFLIPFFTFQIISLDSPTSATLEWNDISELESLSENSDKPILIKIHASWCRPCKMLSKTFEDQEIIDLVKDKYQLVSFDVEDKNTLSFKGKNYQYVEHNKAKYNELALEMLDNTLSYPAILVLDQDLNKLSITRGYKDKTQLKSILKEI